MTIRVVLEGQPEAPLGQAPGRVLLVHADHAFADLAEAIDTAFARWDLTPLHQFEVEGRVLSSPEASGEDPEAEPSDDVTLGEVGLRAGARFTYLFDLGEQWHHECLVEDVGVDPYEAAGEEPEVPVPVYGWGLIPDQYGRVTEDEDEEDGNAWEAGPGGATATVWEDAEADDWQPGDEDLDDWESDDAASWAVVRDALVDIPRELDEDALATAAARLRAGADARAGAAAGAGADTLATLLAAAGVDAGGLPADDRELWLGLAAGVVAPELDVAPDSDTIAAWAALEPADWAGAVIELVRAGEGTWVTPDAMVGMIARCPEVEEGDLTEEGEEVLLEGLGVAIELWRELGVLDADSRLTALGRWGLPESLRLAWDGDAP